MKGDKYNSFFAGHSDIMRRRPYSSETGELCFIFGFMIWPRGHSEFLCVFISKPLWWTLPHLLLERFGPEDSWGRASAMRSGLYYCLKVRCETHILVDVNTCMVIYPIYRVIKTTATQALPTVPGPTDYLFYFFKISGNCSSTEILSWKRRRRGLRVRIWGWLSGIATSWLWLKVYSSIFS